MERLLNIYIYRCPDGGQDWFDSYQRLGIARLFYDPPTTFGLVMPTNIINYSYPDGGND